MIKLPKKWSNRKCDSCSNYFEPVRSAQKYCSPKCAKKAANERAKGKPQRIKTAVDQKQLEAQEFCPQCKNPVAIKYSRRGSFKSCSSYPECKWAISLSPLKSGKRSVTKDMGNQKPLRGALDDREVERQGLSPLRKEQLEGPKISPETAAWLEEEVKKRPKY